MTNSEIGRWSRLQAQATMVGWDFASIADRVSSSKPDWDFDAHCLAAMRSARRVLDQGTGGGERLIAIIEQLGPDAPEIWATEGWEPNIPVATENLKGYGVEVRACDAESGDSIPWPDNYFDVVMSRHESFSAEEVARVLRPAGIFLTQQVSGDNCLELLTRFGGESQYPHVNLSHYTAMVKDAGLEIVDGGEWAGHMHFDDVETLITYLGYCTWEAPEFDVEKHADVLRELADLAAAGDKIALTEKRFWLHARAAG